MPLTGQAAHSCPPPQALERRVLAQVQHELSARAAAICARRGAASLPPLSVALASIKAAAAAQLLALHAQGPGPGGVAAPQLPLQPPPARPSPAPAPALLGTVHGPAPQLLSALGPGADEGAELQRRVQLLEPAFLQLAESLQSRLCPGQQGGQPGHCGSTPQPLASLLRWHHAQPGVAAGAGVGVGTALAWQPQAHPLHGRPAFVALPLPRLGSGPPQLAPPTVPGMQLPLAAQPASLPAAEGRCLIEHGQALQQPLQQPLAAGFAPAPSGLLPAGQERWSQLGSARGPAQHQQGPAGTAAAAAGPGSAPAATAAAVTAPQSREPPATPLVEARQAEDPGLQQQQEAQLALRTALR